MSVSSTIRLTQFLPDEHTASLSSLAATYVMDSYVYSLPSVIAGESSYILPLLAIQSPRPVSDLRTTAYVTNDPDTWSDSPVNNPGLSDNLRFAYGRYGSRYRNLDEYVGCVVHQRLFSKESSASQYENIVSSDGDVYSLEQDIENSVSMYEEAQKEGAVTIGQYDFIVSAYPSPFSYKNSITTDVWIKLSNYVYPLSSGTATLYLDGAAAGSLDITPYTGGLGGFTASWDNVYAFDYDTQVDVHWVVYDEAPTPNKIEFNYWFRTVEDTMGPRIVPVYPTDNSVNVSVSSCISFTVRDYETGIDLSSLTLYINNVLVPFSDLDITALSTLDGYTISYCPAFDFLYDDFIAVSISVSDNSSNSVFYSYNFTTSASLAPRVILSDPLPCRDYVLFNKDVSVYVVDGGNGIDLGTLSFYVDDFTVEYRLLPILYREN